jgi:hypothetical protein
VKLRVSAAPLIAIALVLAMAPARASPCGSQILEFEQAMRRLPDLVGTAPQTVDAQLSHQPTPASVAHAETKAKSEVARALETAKTLDEQGKDDECIAALARARVLLHP